jgi:hypothetical protein
VEKVKRKTTLILTISLLVLLSVSSVIAISQAWWPMKHKPEYVGYTLEIINGEGPLTYIDTSDLPNIIFEGVSGDIVECTVTIDDKVYTYPDDFNYSHSYHLEFNAMTGKGFLRSEAIITFNLPGHPTITTWIVSQASGIRLYPNGTYITPEEVKYESRFEVSGTKQFNKVEGFGLGEAYLMPPEYTKNYANNLGYIKGWPL